MQRPQAQESDSDSLQEGASQAGGGFGEDTADAVEFGWEDKRPLSGRRLKAAKDKQKKAKSGSFGKALDFLPSYQFPKYSLELPATDGTAKMTKYTCITHE